MHIYSLDVSNSSASCGWVAIDQTGSILAKGKDIYTLVGNILSDINSEPSIKVCLGIEAPMWIPLDTCKPLELSLRFPEEELLGWYSGPGAGASMKAQSIGRRIMSEIQRNMKVKKLLATTDKDNFLNGINNLFLFEGFAGGEYKPVSMYNKKINNKIKHGLFQTVGLTNQNLIDAYVTALACGLDLSTPNVPFNHKAYLKIINGTSEGTTIGGSESKHSISKATEIHSYWDDIVKYSNIKSNNGEIVLSFSNNYSGYCNVYGFKF